MSKIPTPTNESVFQIVSDPSVKMKLFYDLIRSGLEISAKPTHSSAEIFHLNPRHIRGSLLISEIAVSGDRTAATLQLLKSKDPKDRELILQFQVGEEKYMTQVSYAIAGENLQLSMERKLFRVQRREFFRLHLPVGFRGHLEIDSIAGVPVRQKLALMDLSGGGCRARAKNLKLPSNTAFDAILKIPGRDDFQLVATIRHQGLVADRSGDQWLGIQFTHPNLREASRMAATVLDLYREYFSRL